MNYADSGYEIMNVFVYNNMYTVFCNLNLLSVCLFTVTKKHFLTPIVHGD